MTGSPEDRDGRAGPGGLDGHGGPGGDVGGPSDGDLTGRLGGEGHDPLDRLLRPPAEFLSAPPGAFDRIRRRAARRRRTRAVAGGTAAVAVIAGAVYLVGSMTAEGGDEVVGPPASSSRTTSAPPSPGPATPSPTATRPAGSSAPLTPGAGSRSGSAPSVPTTTPGATPSATPAAPMCATSQLTASLGGGDAGAGNLYRYLVLTNHSATACHVTGYPGLSMLDGGGSQFGPAATRDARAYLPVVLQPGGSASDTIHTVNQQGTCLPASVKLRIYPPGNTAWLDFPGQVTDCDNRFTITPFTAGTTGNPAS